MAKKSTPSAKKKPSPRRPAVRRVKSTTDTMRTFLSQGRDGEISYMLRSCNLDMTAYGGFVWPADGPVECPDWSAEAECGQGLHGLLWGEGDVGLTAQDQPAKWIVCAVFHPDVVNLGGKIKAPRAWVVYCGDRAGAVEHITTLGAKLCAWGTANAGYNGTANAGYGGTATAGDNGTANAGDNGTATAGDNGTSNAGYNGTAIAGDNGTATAGDNGTATAGDNGTANAGYNGTSNAGYNGTANAGYRGTATVGDNGTATAGEGGIIQIRWHDGTRYRVAIGYVGEDWIEPNVTYKCVNGKLVRA